MKRILEIISAERSIPFAFFLFLLASPAYYLCRQKHFCMAGHLQHPDDFTFLAYATDILWVSALVMSVVLVFRSEVPFRYGFVYALGALFLLFSDPGGLGSILQIPFFIVMALFLVAGLMEWI